MTDSNGTTPGVVRRTVDSATVGQLVEDGWTVRMEPGDETHRIAVLSEPLTYRDGSQTSYFKDLVASKDGNVAASERLYRHGREVTDELARRDKKALRAKPGEVEYRINPNRTTGQGGYLAPPLWLVDQFATAPRPKRVLADLLPRFPLPQGIQSVNIPRLTTGTVEQTVSDLAVDPSVDVVDTSVTSPVVTISGHGDVSLQLLEQSPAGSYLDFALFKDLSEAYDAQLEAQLINGSNAAGQLQGLLSAVPAANTISAAASTATGMYTTLGKTIASIGNNRKLPPEYWLMTTSRLAWLGSSEDQQNRPLSITDRNGSGELDLLTFPVKLDDAIPTTLGAGANQDVIIACRPSDGLLFESSPRASVHLDVLSGTLQARIQLHSFAAALVGRYPSGIAVMNGTNMAVPTGF